MSKRWARITNTVQEFLRTTNINELTHNWSHPVQVFFADNFRNNIRFYKAFLQDLWLHAAIYYAHKASKADIFVNIACEEGICIDVSSRKELEDAFSAGFTADTILANWPKDRCFLEACLQYQVTIAIDAIYELEQILDLISHNDSLPTPRITLRIKPPEHIQASRFGISFEDLKTCSAILQHARTATHIIGISFHIDSIHLSPKKNMILHLIEVREWLLQHGITISHLGIGGWFRAQYTKEHIKDHQHPREYNQSQGVYGHSFLEELLFTEIEEWISFKEYLLESFTTLMIEPGRSLLDQCWISIHSIIGKQQDTITIDGNIYSLGTIAQEMPHDPLFLTHTPWKEILADTQDTISMTMFGNLCLESDRIFSRKIPIPKEVSIGDYVIFINTAWYFADFSDSSPIKHTERKSHIVF